MAMHQQNIGTWGFRPEPALGKEHGKDRSENCCKGYERHRSHDFQLRSDCVRRVFSDYRVATSDLQAGSGCRRQPALCGDRQRFSSGCLTTGAAGCKPIWFGGGEGTGSAVPIATIKRAREPKPQVVAWAVERKDGGRGFGFTGCHFHKLWGIDGFRGLVLNAIVWTAKIEVPKEGVQSSVPGKMLEESRKK